MSEEFTQADAIHLSDATALVRHGTTTGTAFFIAPGILVTCRHVIGGARLEDISIKFGQREMSADEVVVSGTAPDLDAALIMISAHDHPTVPIGPARSAIASVFSFGYQFSDRGYFGYPALGTLAGFAHEGNASSSRRLLQIVDATISPGLSGAPLYSLQDRCVIGIVKRSRPEGGGYATPIEVVGDLRPELSSLLSSTKARRESGLSAYLRQVLAENEYVTLLDLQRSLKLDDVFVSLTLTRNSLAGSRLTVSVGGEVMLAAPKGEGLSSVRRDKGSAQRFAAEEAVNLIDVLAHSKAAIIGDPGCGKSTLLRHIARRVAQGTLMRDRIPVLIRLADLRAELGCFESWIRTVHPAAAEQLLHALQRGTCLLMLDGLDELPRERQGIIAREIERHAAASNQIVLTCRSVSFQKGLFPSDLRVFECVGFNASQQNRFIRRWFAQEPGRAEEFEKQIRGHTGTLGLGRNPLLLSLMAVVAENEPDFHLPVGRPELYEKALRVLIERRMSENRAGMSIRRKLSVLDHIAANGFDQDREVFEENYLLDEIDRVTKGSIDAERALSDLVEIDGVLAPHGPKKYRFLHLTFQEYLTAKALLDAARHLTLPDTLIDREKWEEVIRLMAGMLPAAEAANFIARILAGGSDAAGRFRRLLLSARACSDCQELPAEMITFVATCLLAAMADGDQPIRAAEAEEVLGALARTHVGLLEKVIAPVALQREANGPVLGTRVFMRLLGRVADGFAIRTLRGWFRGLGTDPAGDEDALEFFDLLAEAMAQAGLADVANDLIGLLTSHSNFIATACARSLIQLRPSASQRALLEKYDASPCDVKLLTLAILCSFNDDDLSATLLQKVFAEDDGVVQQAFVHHFNRTDADINADVVAAVWNDLASPGALGRFFGLVRCFRTQFLFQRLRLIALQPDSASAVRAAAIATLLKLDPTALSELFAGSMERLGRRDPEMLRALFAFVPSIQAEHLGRLAVQMLTEQQLNELGPVLVRFALAHRVTSLRPWLEGYSSSDCPKNEFLRLSLALAYVGSREFYARAAQLLSDKSVGGIPQRIIAYRGLGMMDSAEARGLLIQTLEKEKEPAVITEIVMALGRNSDPKATPVLLRLLDPREWPQHWPSPDAPRAQGDQRPSDRRRLSIIYALEQSKAVDAATQLERVAADHGEEPSIRQAAYLAARNISWYRGLSLQDSGPWQAM